MARVLQLRRGTNAENNLFTGAAGELTVDTTNEVLRIHDGATQGGTTVGLDAGFMAPFAGTTAPDGWLICDGSAVSRTDYARLFAAIGTTYGEGDGNSTFNLPDFIGRLPVYDSGSAIGATSDGKLPNITGGFRWCNGQDGWGAFGTGAFGGSYGQGSWHGDWHGTDFDASRSSAVYTDGQISVVPANVKCFWCIKY